jgi:RNA polymerase sigma-70 factor (ECF subfamily)
MLPDIVNNPMLKNILRHYLLRAGLASLQTVDTAADELLSEVVIEAMEHPERLHEVREPVAWLLGIAANLIKRKIVTRSRQNQREPLIRDLFPAEADISDSDLFDRISKVAADPADNLETREQIEWLLHQVSDADQKVLRLAILHELSGERLAKALGTTPGAARVRLHRALSRLRAALKHDLESPQ